MKILSSYQPYQNNEIKKFISTSKPIKSFDFRLKKGEEKFGWVNFYFKHDKKTFKTTLSLAISDLSEIVIFFENIINLTDDIAIFLDDECISEALLYANKIDDDTIQFLIADGKAVFKKWNNNEIQYEPEISQYEVKCNVIIDKKQLLKDFCNVINDILDKHKENEIYCIEYNEWKNNFEHIISYCKIKFKYNELFTPFEWSYSPYTKMWYKDKQEQIPEFPIQNYTICNDIIAETYEFSEYIDYLFSKIDSGNDCFDVTFVFSYSSTNAENSLKEEVCISNDNLPLLEKFINNIKHYTYASIYLEQFAGVKLFAWEHNDKIHFIIQDYKQEKYSETDKPLFKIIFNALMDKYMFYEKMTTIIDKCKEKCKIAIINYQKEHQGAKLSNYDKYFTDWVLS